MLVVSECTEGPGEKRPPGLRIPASLLQRVPKSDARLQGYGKNLFAPIGLAVWEGYLDMTPL